MISIRPLKEHDADLIFKWRNLPSIIQISSSQKEVSWDEHIAWIRASVNNPNRLVYIIEKDGTGIGQVRFEKDKKDATEAIVSIYLVDNFTGKGIGPVAMALSIKEVFEKWTEVIRILAWVRKENQRSQLFFLKQGFLPCSEIQDAEHEVYVLYRNSSHAKNISFYTNLINKYGIDVRSLNWRSKESQELRFRILAEIGDLNGKSILDVGCGLGDFYEYLGKNNTSFQYKGIDITPKMIEVARKRFPETSFEVRDLLEDEVIERFDYVFASGIFYLVEDKPYDFMKKMIKKMFETARIGIAFNSLSAWADSQEKGEFYANPFEVIEFCRTLTSKMVFKHNYHPADFTIFLYK